jgi:hypothetical protein
MMRYTLFFLLLFLTCFFAFGQKTHSLSKFRHPKTMILESEISEQYPFIQLQNNHFQLKIGI